MADTGTATVGSAPKAADTAWYALTPAEVAARLSVDPTRGLTSEEAEQRLRRDGPNALTQAEPEPVWKQFLKHYREYMQIVLVVAAVVSLLIGESGPRIGLAVLTLFNAWLGYHQEGKAEAAAAALDAMMKAVAKVRRDGEVDRGARRADLVPGDVVLVDAGDRVPADGRVIVAATLQVEEGALTGESVAVEKGTAVVKGSRRRDRRPDGHGVHEHQRHPRARRDPGDDHRHGLRGRSHRRTCWPGRRPRSPP